MSTDNISKTAIKLILDNNVTLFNNEVGIIIINAININSISLVFVLSKLYAFSKNLIKNTI